MKGILLAGGAGTRLFPSTQTMSKQLLPLYDKPVIYYPLSTLLFAGIDEVLIISTRRDLIRIEELLGDGKQLGISLSYAVQDQPKGIAEAFTIGADFIGNDSVALILGDNIFYGHELPKRMRKHSQITEGATVFAYHVKSPQDFGVVELDQNGNAISLEEKPADPRSNWAVTGLYFYDNRVVEYAKNLKPSSRGELEITDLNRIYMENRSLKVECLGRGFAWLDAGTPDSLLAAAQFVQMIEERQGLKISALEEISLTLGLITESEFLELVRSYPKCQYRSYLEEYQKRFHTYHPARSLQTDV